MDRNLNVETLNIICAIQDYKNYLISENISSSPERRPLPSRRQVVDESLIFIYKNLQILYNSNHRINDLIERK